MMHNENMQEMLTDDLVLEEDGKYETEQRFIGERITELRMQTGISESKLSYELGHNKNYIRAITVKHAMPSLRGLFGICEYFHLTPSQFFDRNVSPKVAEAFARMKELDEEDLDLLLDILNRLIGKRENVGE